MATITIFGGSGFLAKHLVPILASKGHRLRLASRRPKLGGELRLCGDVGQIVPMAVNILDGRAVAQALKDSDIVVNLVGILFEGSSQQRFQAVQEKGARIVAREAAKAGVKQLIHISAIGADLHSPSAYARSKAGGELAVRQAFPTATIIRPSVIFGAGDGFSHLFARLMVMLPLVPLVGGGVTRLQPVYAKDVSQAIAAVIDQPHQLAPVYELGGPDVLTLKEIYFLIAEATAQTPKFMPLPFPLAKLLAYLLQLWPKPLLTVDQVTLLESDNLADKSLPGLDDLGIKPQPMAPLLSHWLDLYRKGGRFTLHQA